MNGAAQVENRKWLILVCVGMGTFLSSLNSSLTNAILPTIERSLEIPLAQSEWVVLIYLLVLTVTLVPFGRLSDLWGHRTFFLLGFALYSCAEVLCALSDSFWPLFWGRALLAFGGAMVLSVGPAVITATFPPERRGRMLGLQALMSYLGLSLGPVVGGVMTELWGWQSAFFVTVPFALGGLLLGFRVIPPAAEKTRGAVDCRGMLLFILAMTSLALLPNSKSFSGSGAAVPLLLGAVFLCCLAWFIRVERRAPVPLINLSLFRSRNFGFGSLGAALSYLCYYLALFLTPFYLDRILQSSTLETGLCMSVTPVVMMISSPVAGALSDRFGPRAFTVLGMCVSTASLAVLAAMPRVPVSRAVLLLVPGLFFTGLGIGLFAAPNNSAILGAAPKSQQGMASGVLTTFRYFGMSAGTTVGGSLFDRLNTGLLARGFSARAAFLDAFTVVMLIGAGFGILGLLAACSMSRRAPAP